MCALPASLLTGSAGASHLCGQPSGKGRMPRRLRFSLQGGCSELLNVVDTSRTVFYHFCICLSNLCAISNNCGLRSCFLAGYRLVINDGKHGAQAEAMADSL